jgi:hypothetical protein
MMSEASSGRHWKLTVWFELSDEPATFEFDVKPEVDRGPNVCLYLGERQGRTVEVNISVDRVSAWSVEEISR